MRPLLFQVADPPAPAIRCYLTLWAYEERARVRKRLWWVGAERARLLRAHRRRSTTSPRGQRGAVPPPCGRRSPGAP